MTTEDVSSSRTNEEAKRPFQKQLLQSLGQNSLLQYGGFEHAFDSESRTLVPTHGFSGAPFRSAIHPQMACPSASDTQHQPPGSFCKGGWAGAGVSMAATQLNVASDRGPALLSPSRTWR